MDFQKWKKIYIKIVKDFGYDIESDKKAALILSKLLKEKKVVKEKEIRNLIEKKEVTICGAGKNLKNEIEKIKGTVIVADESTSLLMEKDIVPDIIVTDLDGEVEKQITANEKGSIVLIHAHGDNSKALQKWIPSFNGKLMGTTQADPFDEIHNYGGFTDGDRAYCLARHFKARKIYLVGFDLKHPNPKEGKNIKTKEKKLRWAKSIIESLH